MRIGRVGLENFRCHEALELDLDRLTVLIGQNGAGKSTVIEAIQAAVVGRPLQEGEQCQRASPSEAVAVELTLTHLTADDRALLDVAEGEDAHIRRVWREGPPVLLVRRAAAPILAPVRANPGGITERRTEYKQLRAAHPEYPDLPPDQAWERLTDALAQWERQHPELLEVGWVPSRADLTKRLRVIRVAAVREAASEMRESRDSLLGQLVDLLAEQQGIDPAEERLREDFAQRYADEVAPRQRERLSRLEGELTDSLRRYVSTSRVELGVSDVELALPRPRIELRAGQDPELTAVAHQGHGFQRALIVAALHLLAETGAQPGGASVFLGVEEPELFQHPTMVRHLARVLAQLAEGGGPFQVCYTTHSALALNPQQFDSVRLLRRHPGGARSVARASPEAVRARLDSASSGPATRNVTRALDATFAEAFFAAAVVLCEGRNDAAVVRGTADRLGVDLDAEGVVVAAASKGTIPIRYAILRELGIPTYVVFDGDRGAKNEQEARTLNATILALTGAPIIDFPDSFVGETVACFAENMDAYLSGQRGYARRRQEASIELGDSKDEDAAETIRLAVRDFDLPELTQIVQRAVALARGEGEPSPLRPAGGEPPVTK